MTETLKQNIEKAAKILGWDSLFLFCKDRLIIFLEKKMQEANELDAIEYEFYLHQLKTINISKPEVERENLQLVHHKIIIETLSDMEMPDIYTYCKAEIKEMLAAPKLISENIQSQINEIFKNEVYV